MAEVYWEALVTRYLEIKLSEYLWPNEAQRATARKKEAKREPQL